MPPIKIIAHRGGLFYRPENTLAAFQHTVSLGIGWVECDVRLSHDEAAVVVHDDRVPNLNGRLTAVRKLTAHQLSAIDVGGGEGVPQLRQLFDHFAGSLKFDLEIKEIDAVPVVASLVREFGIAGRTVATSFIPEALEQLRYSAPEIPRGLLVDRLTGKLTGGPSAVRGAKLLDCRWLLPHIRRLTPDIVHTAHKENLEVVVWTVNRPEDINFALSCKVDGIISDIPDLVASLADKHKSKGA